MNPACNVIPMSSKQKLHLSLLQLSTHMLLVLVVCSGVSYLECSVVEWRSVMLSTVQLIFNNHQEVVL